MSIICIQEDVHKVIRVTLNHIVMDYCNYSRTFLSPSILYRHRKLAGGLRHRSRAAYIAYVTFRADIILQTHAIIGYWHQLFIMPYKHRVPLHIWLKRSGHQIMIPHTHI